MYGIYVLSLFVLHLVIEKNGTHLKKYYSVERFSYTKCMKCCWLLALFSFPSVLPIRNKLWFLIVILKEIKIYPKHP